MNRINSLLILIEMFPEKNFLWDSVYRNPNFALEYLPYLQKTGRISACSMERAAKLNTNIYKKNKIYDLDKFVNETPELAICYLRECQKITLDMVKSLSPEIWRTHMINACVNVSLNDIKRNPKLPWDPSYLIVNPSITLDMIFQTTSESPLEDDIVIKEDKLYINWPSALICCNPNISIQDLLKYPNIEQDLMMIIGSGNISVEEITEIVRDPKNIDIFESVDAHYWASDNPNATWYDVVNNESIRWDFSSLSSNTFSKVPKWNYGEGWYFVPQMKLFPYRREIWFLYHICKNFNQNPNNVQKNLYIPNEIYHMIIEFILAD